MDVADRQFNRQNQTDWKQLQTLVQKNGSILYALPLYQKDSLYRELNINQIEEDKFGLIKEYIVHKKKKETELRFYTINGRLIESGLLTANNLYLRKKVEKGNTIRLMGGESGFDFNDGKGDGNPLGGVTVTGPSPSTPFFIPSGPSGCNTCYYGGGGSGGGGGNETGGGSGGEGENKDIDTTMTPDFYKNAKVMCTLSKLMENNFYKNTLNKFIGKDKPIDLSFKLENITQEPGYVTAGNTVPRPRTWNSKNIDVTIAANVIDNLSSIEVAITLLHEGIHAEIYRKLLSIHGESKLSNLNFPTLFNMYLEYGKTYDGYKHEYMANNYVNTIANALKQYDKNKFDIEYYQAFAWDGLKFTKYYIDSVSATQKTEIESKKKTLLANRSKKDCDDL